MDIGELKVVYQRTYPAAQRLQDTLKEQIEQLLSSQNITLGVPIESRVKTWDSLSEKIERKALTLSAVEELDDLVGLRLILLFRRDVAKVCDLLSQTFDVVTFEDASQRLAETQFGYQSLHYVVRLPRAWLSVPTLQDLEKLKAEVQVRTLAQHIWAAASHKLQYKQEENVPPPVRRAIYRVSALLETVDLEFERVLSERESYISVVGTQDGESNLNVDLLEKILDELLPAQNKSTQEAEDYSGLMADLRHFKVDTIDKLRGLINKHFEAVLSDDVDMAKLNLRSVNRRDNNSASKQRFERGIFFTHVGLTRQALEREFGQEFRRYLLAKLKS